MSATLKDVGKSTPVVEVIRRILESRKGPVSVGELTAHTLEHWGRDFPTNPFEDAALVYRLATRVLNCRESYEELGGEPPTVKRSDEGGEDVPLRPDLGYEHLNQMVDQLRHVTLTLPER